MLQMSQIEKPRCSAKIDQMRLRWAMNLPVDFQNVSSSGFHSEIQLELGLLIRVFLSGGARPREPKTTNVAPGARKRSSQGGGVACSVREKTHGASSGDGVAFALQAPCQPAAREQSAGESMR